MLSSEESNNDLFILQRLFVRFHTKFHTKSAAPPPQPTPPFEPLSQFEPTEFKLSQALSESAILSSPSSQRFINTSDELLVFSAIELYLEADSLP